jgi:hypothetical protein
LEIGRLFAADGAIDDTIVAYQQAARTLEDLRPDLIALARATQPADLPPNPGNSPIFCSDAQRPRSAPPHASATWAPRAWP